MEHYNVTGMSCAACSARVEKAVSKLDGVNTCSVNLLTNSMVVEGNIPSNQIIEAVEKAGYHAALQDSSSNNPKADNTAFTNNDTIVLRNRLLSSLIVLAIP